MKTQHWGSLTSSSAAAVVVGFASTILVVMEGLRAVGATPAQQASGAASICIAMAITSLILCWRSKMPVITAWSTPGAVLLATGAAGTNFPEAVGAFIFAGVLMAVTGLIKPIEKAIEKMPATIAAAMLAGVLFRYVGGVPSAAMAIPAIVVPLIIVFFVLRVVLPLYTVPIVVGLGVALAALMGLVALPTTFGITPFEFVMPVFDWQTMVSIGFPLYLVTMASQNLPGFAVQRSFGYQPPVSDSLVVTGIGSALFSVFGSHAVNLAAITASLVAGPDAHPDPSQRWKAVLPYAVMYVLVGLAAGTFVTVLGGLPKDVVVAIAGLSLFAPMMNGFVTMIKDPKDIDAAVVTFLVTASGITLFSVGSAFWGLVAGLVLWGAKRLLK